MVDLKKAKRYIIDLVNEKGDHIIEGECKECGIFPCRHIDTITWKLRG